MRYPDRPRHPDLHLLSHALRENDARADSSATASEVIGGIIDPDSVLYAVEHRLVRKLGGDTLTPAFQQALRATWIDGFTAGARFQILKDRPAADSLTYLGTFLEALGESLGDNPLLATMIPFAVVLRIPDYRDITDTERVAIAYESSMIVAAGAPMFTSDNDGEPADAFNALARGLGVCAYAPGGVTFLGKSYRSETKTRHHHHEEHEGQEGS